MDLGYCLKLNLLALWDKHNQAKDEVSSLDFRLSANQQSTEGIWVIQVPFFA